MVASLHRVYRLGWLIGFEAFYLARLFLDEDLVLFCRVLESMVEAKWSNVFTIGSLGIPLNPGKFAEWYRHFVEYAPIRGKFFLFPVSDFDRGTQVFEDLYLASIFLQVALV